MEEPEPGLKAGNDTEVKEGCCLLPPPHGLLSLPYPTQSYHPRDGSLHSELGPTISITNQENAYSLI